MTSPLEHADWFASLLDDTLIRADALEARVRAGLGDLDDDPDEYGVRRSVAEDWIERSARERGLAFGVAAPDGSLDAAFLACDAHASGFLVTLRHEVELALEVAVAFGRDLHDAPPRRGEVAALFLQLTVPEGEPRAMEALGDKPRKVRRALRDVGERLAGRLEASRVHPPWTLSGARASATRRLCDIALDLHERWAGKARVAGRMGAMGTDACLAAVEAMAGVAWADGEFAPEERALIEERIALSGFTRAERRWARKALATPRPPAAIAADLSDDPRNSRFVLQQVVLECHADGVVDPSESAYVVELADALGLSAVEVDQVEGDIAAFYSRHAEHLQRSPGASAMRSLVERTTERIARAVRSNSAHLVQEIRETQDLSRLLLKAGRGEDWTREERERAKAQLIDICRTVPALAIFALPGGGLLLPVLIKVLPFNVLPSAFAAGQDGEDG